MLERPAPERFRCGRRQLAQPLGGAPPGLGLHQDGDAGTLPLDPAPGVGRGIGLAGIELPQGEPGSAGAGDLLQADQRQVGGARRQRQAQRGERNEKRAACRGTPPVEWDRIVHGHLVPCARPAAQAGTRPRPHQRLGSFSRMRAAFPVRPRR